MSDNEDGRMGECVKCIHEAEIQALKVDSEHNSTTHREFYNKFEDIKVKQSIFDNNQNNMFSLLNEIKDDVKTLKEKPSRNFDAIKMCIVTALVSGVVGYVVSFLFK